MPEKARGTMSEFESGLRNLLNPTTELTGIFGELSRILDRVYAYVKPFSEVQKSAIELAKSVGLASKTIMATATRTIEQNRRMQLSMSYNMSTQEMIGMQTALMNKLGRNVAIDQVGSVQRNAAGEIVNPNFDSDLENLIAATKVFGEGRVGDIVAGFDHVGKSMKEAAKATGKLYKEAGEYGINLTKYAENFTTNLGMAQTYNFRNGVNGLREMARKATEIRQDMKQIAQFADKVGSVTGAVETAANLQVLGGSFATMANPLAMLNESLTDMEALQKRFSDMTIGAATYDQNTHEIRMDAFNRMRLKRAAEAMGVDPNNLIDQAYAQARQAEISRQMTGMGNLTPEFKKMIVNAGQIDSETGAAGVTIGNKFVSLADMAAMGSDEQIALQQQMIEENRSESEDIKAIAKSVMGIEDLVSGRKKQMSNEAARANIMPGVISGLSSLDMAMNLINEKFTPQVIEGAGKINQLINNVGTFWETFTSAPIVGLIGTLAADTPEQFGNAFQQLATDLFGTSSQVQAFGKTIGDVMSTIYGTLQKYLGPTSYVNERAGINLFAPSESYLNGESGRETPPVAREPESVRSEVLASRDLVTEANYLSSHGGHREVMAPIVGGELMNNRVTISGNDNSMPTATVAPTKSEAQTAQQTATEQQQTTQSGNYNFNVSGTLTMNVNGDNGRIGSVDVMKMLQDDPDFKRMLAYEIAKAMKEVDARGGGSQ